MAAESIMTAPSKSDQAYVWIRQKIMDGEYTPGYRLVLATLARELEMSVVPVREAIRRLEAEGVVSFERNVGATVKMVDEGAYIDSMTTLAVIEAAALGLYAPSISKRHLDEATRINQKMIDTLEDFDPRVFTVLNQEFHSTLLLDCPNHRLTELVTTEWARLANLRNSTFSFIPSRAWESVQEHANIVTAIKKGAPAPEIETLFRAHRMTTLGAYLEKRNQGESGAT